ncbi:hypothetical protein D8674_043099 [Pyrus ussuriensis x Pyrus communis]|uniref:Uncharacterized protein n=1 Tax=Pyrus ussuriensis x Pyrus communis TaxID=2448454 RepID=A0A5N5I6V8_9ROSA|nr:hypothetical protein D8674_043099 [Pyrus ussuriensis x Pyrus communis]
MSGDPLNMANLRILVVVMDYRMGRVSAPPGHPYSYYGGSQDGTSSSYGCGLVSHLLYGVTHSGDSSSHSGGHVGGYPQNSPIPSSAPYGDSLAQHLFHGVPHSSDSSSLVGGYRQLNASTPRNAPYLLHSYYGGSQDCTSSPYSGDPVQHHSYWDPHYGDFSSHAGGYLQLPIYQDSASSSYGGAYHGGYSGALSRLQQQQQL